MRPYVKITCLIVLLAACIPATVLAATFDGAVAIFVEDSRGQRVATGNGLVLAPDGVVATDSKFVLSWLESDKNSLIVRTGSSGYYPLDSLISVDRKTGIALFRIGVQGLKTARIAHDYMPVIGDRVSIFGSPDGLKVGAADGTVKKVLSDGRFEITVSIRELSGSPVLNQEGAVVAIAVFHDGLNLAVPVGKFPSLPLELNEEETQTEASQIASIKKAKAAIRGTRARPEDYFRLGVAYRKAGMGKQAIEAFEEALRLKSDYAEAYQGLGVSLAGEGNYDEAIAALKKAVATRPDYAAAHMNLGFLYDHTGRHEESVASFREALRLKPGYAEAYNGLGVSFARVKNYEEAIKYFKQALRLRPEMKKARFNLALSYISLGDTESARREEALLRGVDPELADRLLDFLETDAEAADHEGEGFADEGVPDEVPDEGPEPR